jgi:threonine dehydrogenase-like Zn-dependent dehydrogenase
VEIGLTLWRTLRISGAGGTRDFGERTIRFMERIRDRWDFKALNTHRFPFGRLVEAFEVACRGKAEALKVMLVFS